MAGLTVPGVYGHVCFEQQAPMEEAGARSAQPPAPVGRVRELAQPGLAVGAVDGWVLADNGICCAISGNLDWLDYELSDCQLKHNPAHALVLAYRRHGVNLLAKAGGRFALFLWDKKERIGLLAGDRFGRMSIYWARRADGGMVFAPTATAVIDVLDHPVRLSDQGIFNYLYYHMVPAPATVYQGVNRLMAAHALVAEEGEWHTFRYWEPSFREQADASMSDAGEEMLGLLASSVSRLASGVDTGAFLSGGLDSSTVAGLLARFRPRPKTYSIGFNADGYDETAYARIASERFKTDLQTYYVTPEDVLAELPRIAGAYDEPFGNSSTLPAYFCARLAAADGRTRLLAGDGGDELFAGNERYARQILFERYGRLPAWSRRWLLEPLLLNSLAEGVRLVGKARSYIDQAKIPLPERLQTYNFMSRFDAARILEPDFLASVDTQVPIDLDRALFRHPRSVTLLNRMLYLDWHHTLADNNLRKVNRMCQLAGVEVEYPMLDDRLVEFSTRVSTDRKMRHNRLRDFFKRAVADFLPREIIDKPKHGFGLPFGVWLAEHPGLQQLARDKLARMKRRPYVRADFIDDIVQRHHSQHAGYYGEFIWVLIMLELWLTAQGIEP